MRWARARRDRALALLRSGADQVHAVVQQRAARTHDVVADAGEAVVQLAQAPERLPRARRRAAITESREQHTQDLPRGPRQRRRLQRGPEPLQAPLVVDECALYRESVVEEGSV